MFINQKIFLPGTNEQVKLLQEKISLVGISAVIFGSNSEKVAEQLAAATSNPVTVIVEDYDSLINTQLVIEGKENISVKMMSFESTDFKPSEFDLVYAQASISGHNRNKIVKEIKRILKPEGYFCVGEVVAKEENIPVVIKNLWENSGLSPLNADKINRYYEERNFKIEFEADLSRTLRDFYSMSSRSLQSQLEELSEREKSFYKKLLNRISHETNVFLKQGGDRFIGFKMLLMRKQQ